MEINVSSAENKYTVAVTCVSSVRFRESVILQLILEFAQELEEQQESFNQ